MQIRHLKIAVLVAVVMLGSVGLGCKLNYVSFSEAEKSGDNYYHHLRSGNITEVMSLYSSEFTDAEFRVRWSSFLEERIKNWGAYQEHTLVREQFLPRVKGDPSVPADRCYLMKYSVVFSTVTDQETLIFCPDPPDNVLRIVGHTLEREGVAPVSAGMTVKESGIRFGQ